MTTEWSCGNQVVIWYLAWIKQTWYGHMEESREQPSMWKFPQQQSKTVEKKHVKVKRGHTEGLCPANAFSFLIHILWSPVLTELSVFSVKNTLSVQLFLLLRALHFKKRRQLVSVTCLSPTSQNYEEVRLMVSTLSAIVRKKLILAVTDIPVIYDPTPKGNHDQYFK